MNTRETSTTGIFFILIGMAAISLNDVLIKQFSGGYPLHQLVFTRSFIGLFLSIVFLQMEGGWTLLKTSTPGLHLLRAFMVVLSNMSFFAAIAVLPLAETLDMTPHLPRQIRHYSFGMRQKLSVLLALASDPKVLLLDETFNGLDPASSLTLKHYLSRRVVEEGLAVILATHSLDIVERYCNTLLVLGEGGARGYWDGGAFAKLVASPGQLESALAAQSGGA